MKKIDFFVGLGLTFFSIIGIVYNKTTFTESKVGLSAGAFPTFLLIILLLCGIAIFLSSFKIKENIKVNIDFKKTIPIVVILVLYSTLFKYFGFVIPTILFLFTTMLMFKEKRKKILFLVPVITTLSIYFIFKLIFRIPLP